MKTTKMRTRAGVATALLGSITLVAGLIAPVAGADPNENANGRAFEATGSDGGQQAGRQQEGEVVHQGGSDAEVSSAGAGPSEDGARGQARAEEVKATEHSNNGGNGTGDQGKRPQPPKEPKAPNEPKEPKEPKEPNEPKESKAPNDNSANNDLRDPPGNNGTIKIDGLEWDEHPDNEPHPGCLFEVDFYNHGPDREATLSFTAQAPTGSGEQILGEPLRLDLEGDGAGGGTDHDGAIRVDLTSDLSRFEPHPKQGYHVKLTVTVDDEDDQGAQVKHKVFWVGPCEGVGGIDTGGGVDTDGGTVSGIVTTPTPDEVAGVVIKNPPVQSPGAVVTNPGPNVVVEQPASGSITPEVLGVQLTRSPGQPTAQVLGAQATRSGQLPRTGSDLTNFLTLAGMVMLFSGLFLVTQSGTQSRKGLSATG